jgi:transposase
MMNQNRVELEARRLAAVEDIKAGTRTSALVRRYQVTRTTIGRWRHAVKDGQSLARRMAPGRPRRLTGDQDAVLKRMYLLGPELLLDEVDHWTQDRFARAVERYIGIRYSADHMGRIMHRLGLTVGRRGRVPGSNGKRQAGG